MAISTNLRLKIINAQELARRIERMYHAKKVLGGILRLTPEIEDLGLIWIGQISKYFLKWRDYVVIDNHHLDYLEKISRTTQYNIQQSQGALDFGLQFHSIINIMFCENVAIPMLDGSDFVLTPAFGHAIRINKVIDLILSQSEFEGLSLIDLYATSHGIASGLKLPKLTCLDSDSLNIMPCSSTYHIPVRSSQTYIFNLANARLLNYAPTINASEGMRTLCAMTRNSYKSQFLSSVNIRSTKRVPILSRNSQRAPRWTNAHELCMLNPSCFFQITPEDYDPYQLSELLDQESSLVIAAPGSAAYIPLCLCKRPKLVLMPLAGQPEYNIDGYVYDFACFGSSVQFVMEKRNNRWNWNDEFTIHPKLLLHEIRKAYASLKSNA